MGRSRKNISVSALQRLGLVSSPKIKGRGLEKSWRVSSRTENQTSWSRLGLGA